MYVCIYAYIYVYIFLWIFGQVIPPQVYLFIYLSIYLFILLLSLKCFKCYLSHVMVMMLASFLAWDDMCKQSSVVLIIAFMSHPVEIVRKIPG